jgi:hypothetical protein
MNANVDERLLIPPKKVNGNISSFRYRGFYAMSYALCDLERVKKLFKLLNIFGEWSGGEGEEKGHKHYTAH